MSSNNGETPKLNYNCAKCPAYCCSYAAIAVTRRDVKRLARHFDIDVEIAERRFTKMNDGDRVLRHQKDAIYGTVCMFLDTKTRRCTIYDARPQVCHEYPARSHCGYYDFLRWERTFQQDPEFVPLKKS